MSAIAHRANSTVTLTVQLPVVGGSVVMPTSISWTLTDETGAVIAGPTSVAPPGAGSSITVTLGPTDNQLAAGVVRSARILSTLFETASGEFLDTQSYIVQSDAPLIRMVNSFVTWPETALVRYEMPSLNGWDASTQDQQIAALYTAHQHMLQLRYRFPIGENFQSRIVDFYGMSVDNVFGRIYMTLADIAYYTEIDYNGWPMNFREALKRGQMAEANFLLAGDPVADKRDAGILSEKTGESSMSFSRVPAVTMAVSRDALNELKGYLNNATLVGRG